MQPSLPPSLVRVTPRLAVALLLSFLVYLAYRSALPSSLSRRPRKMPLQIQVASDLHIEFYDGYEGIPKDIVVPKAPVLALLGDIGLACTDQLREFLYQQANQFETVLLLIGNHEFYNSGGTSHTVQEQTQWLRDVCDKQSNLHLLENTAMELKGVRILGTALWSDIPSSLQPRAAQSMNDYHISYIADEYSKMTRQLAPSDTSQWHSSAVAWLEQEIEASTRKNQPVLVLTHHTPSLKGTSSPQYEGSSLSHCFSTDLTRLLRSPLVKAWCCGHTHYNFDFMVHSTRLVSNQRGYAQSLTKGYDPSFVLEVE